jgi:predicted enzyme related to lactoylglutathione lyase
MAGEVAFFELGVEDVDRGRAFYEGLFGWRFEPGPSGEGFTIDGGEESVALWGRFKLCRDDQGSPFGLHQPPAGS